MNIIEAMDHVKKGYFIRRSWWKPEHTLAPAFYDFGQGMCEGDNGWRTFPFIIDDLTANDWEVGPKWPLDRGPYPEDRVAEHIADLKKMIAWQMENKE